MMMLDTLSGRVAATATLMLVAGALHADTLELRNGSTLQGAYAGGTPEAVRFTFNGSTQDYARGDIASLTFSEQPPAEPVPPVAASVATTEAADPGVQSPTTLTLPTGTTLVASLQGGINSGKAESGQKFNAVLVSDLRVGEQVVLPAGTALQGEVVKAESAGIFRKSADLVLTLDAINYNGQLIAIRTGTQQEASESKVGREVVGGAAKGAALGAIVGAITGDAGDGAAAGAAAGGAGGLLHRGSDVEYASGSVLAFTLESPVTL